MAKPIEEGDTVQVSDREPTPADIKSQLFYAHYRHLTGTVAKVYADGTVALNVETASLPNQILSRHNDGADVVRRKFLGELSEEGRNKLSAAEKKFNIQYTILIATSDLQPIASSRSQAVEKVLAAPGKVTAGSETLFDVAPEPPRPTLADLERAEAEHLEERRKSS